MTITTKLLSVLFILLLAGLAGALNVIVFPKLNAVAQKIAEVAVDLKSAQILMVLHFVIYDIVHINGQYCLTNNIKVCKKDNDLVHTNR